MPLPLGEYNNLVRHLNDTEMQPADLLGSEGLRELDNSWSSLKSRRTLEDVRQLLERGFLLAQALERWSARAIWVLGNNLERAALNRVNREPLMDGRLVLVSSFDPAVRFRGWQAMERNKPIYALADAALVVNSDLGHGGTWAGATGQLAKLRYVPVYVRSRGEPCRGLDELVVCGADRWSEPKTPSGLREILFDDASPVPELAGPRQGELFPSQAKAAPRVSVVREGWADDA